MATCRVCCGATDNGKADCKEFVDRMEAKPGVSVNVYGNDKDYDATAADFAGGKNYDVMYWSGHSGGLSANRELKSRNVSGGYFDAFTEMGKWTTSNTLKVLILAACYMLQKSRWADWQTIFGKTNLRVVCGYRKTAPTGSGSDPTDKQIVTRFFKRINDGKGVKTAWKYANQLTSASKGSWAVISYRGSTANNGYKMPGWSTNSGASRTGGLWIMRQTSPEAQELSTLMSKGISFIDDDSYLEEIDDDVD